MLKKPAKTGFTLIELALSLVFIGILSVSVVLIINDTMASYRRGMTLNHINTAGMDLVDDFRSAVQNSSARSVLNECVKNYPDDTDSSSWRTKCLDDGGSSFISITRRAQVELSDSNKTLLAQGDEVPVFGAFCTGTYSYIWNSGYFEGNVKSYGDAENQYAASGKVISGVPAYLKYYVKNDANNSEERYNTGLTKDEFDRSNPLRILKVWDEYRAVCISAMDQYNTVKNGNSNMYTPSVDVLDPSNEFVIPEDYTLTEDPVELLLTDNYNDLAIYDLEVAKPAESTTRNNSFYAVSFILGTISGGIDIKAKGQSCNPPSDYEIGYFDYCAINKFSFAVQANGERK